MEDKATIQFELYGRTTKVVLPDDDLDSDEMIKSFCHILLTHGYFLKSIISSLETVKEDLKESMELSNLENE